MISSVDKAWTDDWLRRTPLGRMGTTDEVGKAVVALASNQFTFMTGAANFTCGPCCCILTIESSFYRLGRRYGRWCV